MVDKVFYLPPLGIVVTLLVLVSPRSDFRRLRSFLAALARILGVLARFRLPSLVFQVFSLVLVSPRSDSSCPRSFSQLFARISNNPARLTKNHIIQKRRIYSYYKIQNI